MKGGRHQGPGSDHRLPERDWGIAIRMKAHAYEREDAHLGRLASRLCRHETPSENALWRWPKGDNDCVNFAVARAPTQDNARERD